MGEYGFLIIMAVMLVAMMLLSSRSKKKMAQQQQDRERKLIEGLVPGAWVKTAFGFWGRYVDQDGDIVILETPDGTETYWERQTIRDVGEPPFAADEPATPETEDEDEDEPVLGLDTPEPPTSPIETDEDDKRH
ncbi:MULTISPECIES: preprotein translocase subunit YajC [Actinomyces]|uniref:preprotein translocase subunit YajC n=1 Tax=Actinomyces TaxID=1654 RepID=UPI001E3CF5FB|nr:MULTISPECIES: preprotein translocase subunit YajC [Actinomyces]